MYLFTDEVDNFLIILSIFDFQSKGLECLEKIMFILLFLTLITLIIANLVIIISSILSKKTILDREKVSPYECGFDPKESARLPFSLRFFLIAVIFLIFDVEITLLLPIASTLRITNIFSWIITGVLFLVILLLGLYYEWVQGALEWSR